MNLTRLKMRYRKELLVLRRSLSPELRSYCSSALCERLLAIVEAHEHSRLFAYAPIKGEPDLLPLASRLPEGRFLLPFTHLEQSRLSFHTWSPGQELVINRYGIAEPLPTAAQEVRNTDIIAVPALAFSMQGFRLGYGGGFYDRLLSQSSGISIGIA